MFTRPPAPIVLLAVVFAAAASAPAAPQRRPAPAAATRPVTTRPATRPTVRLTASQKAAVDGAVDALRKEFAAAQKDPKAPLRTQADFFADKKPADLTPEAVLTALEQPVPGDPRAAAYVRWQLMSALPEKLD